MGGWAGACAYYAPSARSLGPRIFDRAPICGCFISTAVLLRRFQASWRISEHRSAARSCAPNPGRGRRHRPALEQRRRPVHQPIVRRRVRPLQRDACPAADEERHRRGAKHPEGVRAAIGPDSASEIGGQPEVVGCSVPLLITLRPAPPRR